MCVYRTMRYDGSWCSCTLSSGFSVEMSGSYSRYHTSVSVLCALTSTCTVTIP